MLPQAFRNMMPVLLTQTIILFQDTSLVYVISATDFLGAAAKIANRDYRLVEMYTFVAVVYFIISFSLSLARETPPATGSPSSDRISMAMIEIKNVSKWYGSFQVLTDCTTEVAKGEVVVVCGPSGSGKSHAHQDASTGWSRSRRATSPSTASRWATRRPTCRSCARASAWCSRTSSSSRTCR